jgi:hypothetical protein
MVLEFPTRACAVEATGLDELNAPLVFHRGGQMEMVCRRVPGPRRFLGIENAPSVFEGMRLMSSVSPPLLADVKPAAAYPDTVEFGLLRQLWNVYNCVLSNTANSRRLSRYNNLTFDVDTNPLA